jgi:hypothetical protein
VHTGKMRIACPASARVILASRAGDFFASKIANKIK